MKNGTINWGIMAPGRIAHKFTQDLKCVPGAKLLAVASRNLARAQVFAAEYNAPHAFGSYEELLSCPDLDAVYIASPHTGHHEQTLMCLNAGIAVLCEKPFAMNLPQVQEMVTLAKAKNVFLMEALWSRFMPTVLKTRELVETGAIGKLVGVKADFGFKAPFDSQSRTFNKDLGGGALLDIGIYPLFLSYLILGMPTKITASAVFGPTGVDESTGMTMQYTDGTFAFLDCTFMAKTPCEGFVYGEEGFIKIHSRWHESKGVTLERYDGTSAFFDFDRPTFGYDYEAIHVGECLQQGLTESPVWTLTDSLNLMKLLDNVRAQIGLVYE
jgi:predicted dehydrogenase